MTTVPAAGCLLARNQFYRSRLNPISSASSCSSYRNNVPKAILIPAQESSHQGLPIALEKSRWISSLFASPVFSKFTGGSTHR
uniref:pancreatic progenitor cell differentiation and proliferation factor-like protein n=1 Tax=Pristiophorus japonicus TaxID=55135 RepID=UPI00398E492C